MSLEEWDVESVAAVERDIKMKQLLWELASIDELFESNVPGSIRNSYSDSKLHDHLKQVYSQKTFIIEKPEDIEKHIQVGDRVIKKGEYKEKTAELKQGDDIGAFVEMKSQDHALINFFIKGEWFVHVDDLVVTHGSHHGFFRTTQKEFNDVPLRDFSKIREGYKVKYMGKDFFEYNGIHIPDGSFGLVTKILPKIYGADSWRHPPISQRGAQVVWARNPDLRQIPEEINNLESELKPDQKLASDPHQPVRVDPFRSSMPSPVPYYPPQNFQPRFPTNLPYMTTDLPGPIFGYDEIKLVRPNRVDFDKIYHKTVLGEEL